MSRVQLAINVTDVDAAVAFYSKLFKTEPAKRRPGYANFAIAEPPLKLVLNENADAEAGGTLNHLGVEVDSVEEVDAATRRLSDDGLATAPESGECCYALQEKVWVNDPDGAPWEIYTVIDHVEHPAGELRGAVPGAGHDAMCCGTATESAARCC